MSNRKTLLTFWVLLLVGLISAPSLWAADQGELFLIRGKVKITLGGESKIFTQANQTTPLAQGAQVQTAEDTRARVVLYSSDTVELYANSLVKLDQLNQKNTRIDLPLGKVRFTVNPQSGGRRFQVRTLNAVLGVKGTDFLVQSIGGATQAMDIEGLVSLANAQGGGSVDLGPNSASQVLGNQPPAKPVKVTKEQQTAILAQDEAESWDQLGLSLPEEAVPFEVGTGGIDEALDSLKDVRENLGSLKDTLNVTDRELKITVTTDNEPFE
ncbi:MAG: FecR family protein [bacterium]|nr:FecR family protein [bacterium]